MGIPVIVVTYVSSGCQSSGYFHCQNTDFRRCFRLLRCQSTGNPLGIIPILNHNFDSESNHLIDNQILNPVTLFNFRILPCSITRILAIFNLFDKHAACCNFLSGLMFYREIGCAHQGLGNCSLTIIAFK